jgi:tRNA(Ser,Leu) C12 N-acetylase TAN1
MRKKSTFIVTVSAGFETEAKKEIESLIMGAKVRILFFKGNLLVECPQDEGEIVSNLREASTSYVGRVSPVDSKVKISSRKESISSIYEHILLLGKLKDSDSFVVRCWRRGSHDFSSLDVERELGSLLEKTTGAAVSLKKPKKTVVVQIFQDLAFVGVTDAENLLVKRIRVSRKYGKGERPFTRAEHKIKEAIEAFDLRIEENFLILDLGAAPGGWTKVLAGLAKKVVAVDPAGLDPAVRALPNVVHFKCKAEELPSDVGQFDLITNDMNLSSIESARIMVALAGRLGDDGIAIMTVKFVTRNRKRHLSEAIGILKTRYTNFKAKRLPHNRYETTLFMQKI